MALNCQACHTSIQQAKNAQKYLDDIKTVFPNIGAMIQDAEKIRNTVRDAAAAEIQSHDTDH